MTQEVTNESGVHGQGSKTLMWYDHLRRMEECI